MIIIQSANDELEDEHAYTDAGADGSIGKAVKGGVQSMLRVLGRAWHERFDVGVDPLMETHPHEQRQLPIIMPSPATSTSSSLSSPVVTNQATLVTTARIAEGWDTTSRVNGLHGE